MKNWVSAVVVVATTTLLPLLGSTSQASANPAGFTATKCVDFSYYQPFRTAIPVYGAWRDDDSMYTLVLHHSFCRGYPNANPSAKVAWFNASSRSHRYVSASQYGNFLIGDCINQSDPINTPTSAPIYTSCQFDVNYVRQDTTPAQGAVKVYAAYNQDPNRADEATGGYEILPGRILTRRYTMAVNPVNGCVYISGIGRTDPVACY
ncbi:hypothetical protein ACFPM7_29625 [Actinokineospora guangxiensis]|uniref:Secreted protein n=1 Tax=Actinokineospora guangxiensis TaxID=1490288 RepID=A0ABW0EYB4_9PSEU